MIGGMILKKIGGKVASKLAGKAVSAVLAPFIPYLIAAAIAALVGVVGAIGYYIYGAEKAKGQVVVLELRLDNVLTTLDRNEASLEQCRGINAENENEALRQASLARIATERVIALQASIDRDIEDISHEVETYRTELGCPALTDDFRQWVLDPG